MTRFSPGSSSIIRGDTSYGLENLCKCSKREKLKNLDTFWG